MAFSNNNSCNANSRGDLSCWLTQAVPCLVGLSLTLILAVSIGCKESATPSAKDTNNASSGNRATAAPPVSDVVAVESDGETEAPDIFAAIWDLPESHVAVTKFGEDDQPLDPNAVVIVREQGRAGRCLDEDNAPLPLLTVTDESVFSEPTFRTFIALLDNYKAAERVPEPDFDDPSGNWQEVEAFLDAVFDTKPMKVAVEHIQSQLAPGETAAGIRQRCKQIWFEPYTNHYRSAQPYCVGFEHVFVGEDESGPEGAPKCEDRVGGYHSWVKFYREQQVGKVDCLGYDYPDGNVADALDDFKVTTIVMRWSPTKAEDGSHGHDLLKKPGGFFVGTRPELEITFGLLAWYSQQAGRFDNIPGKENHHRVRLGEFYFDLVMHPQSLAPPQGSSKAERGPHIRTLYPKFRGRTIPGEIASQPAAVDLPTQPHNDSPIRIARALPNPSAPDDVGEWVELQNTTDVTSFDLTLWRLLDQSGRSKALTGTLAPGETKRIELERADERSMMLKNGSGWILLYQGESRRAAVKYDSPKSDVPIEF